MDRWTCQHSDQLDQIDEPPEDTITYVRSKVCLMHAFMSSSPRAGVFVAQAAAGNHGPDIQLWLLTASPWAVGVAACACRTDRGQPGSLLPGNGQKAGGVRRFIRHDVQLADHGVYIVGLYIISFPGPT
ncbi:hypothetical protein OIU84_014127 [Salix udensis]|uniref:Uncharacterized protein n=1 Tax=Salix udensis TaxID=889485 RepID=A0AAD6JC94_9ROSI|nr:hypothetical protein OIU84_014127 [Salix udensis]